MRIFFKAAIAFLFAGIAFSLCAYYYRAKPKFKIAGQSLNSKKQISGEEFSRLKFHASSIKKFAFAKHYNCKVCFLADMQMPSGKNRFFVYDLQKDSILLSGLVAHGSCDNGFQSTVTFSNKENSGCSCFGKFKIGNSYIGKFGIAYKLYGLDSSNSNAFNRTIVLHSYNCVPNEETQPLPICNSRGCAMVSPLFIEKLKSYLGNSSKEILLDIF